MNYYYYYSCYYIPLLTFKYSHVIKGPPGTGKTSFLIATLIRMVADNSLRQKSRNRILVCAPSNKATCLLLERFVSALLPFGESVTHYLNNVVLLGVQDKIQSVTTADSTGNSYQPNHFILAEPSLRVVCF
jgi:hypothetical protein